MKERILELSRELEYFAYLVSTHEIRDENTLRYYVPKIDSWLNAATIHLHGIKNVEKPKTGSGFPVVGNIPA